MALSTLKRCGGHARAVNVLSRAQHYGLHRHAQIPAQVPLHQGTGIANPNHSQSRQSSFLVSRQDPGQGHPISIRLDNGKEFHGQSFGARKEVSGEFVFSTGMTGYPEMLTDPSYSGQVLVLTYPIIGNYGAPDTISREATGLLKYAQSQRIHITGLVVQNYTHEWSHWQGVKSLHEWLLEHNIPGIYGVDTREMTKTLRESGVMLGKMGAKESLDGIKLPNYEEENLCAKVCGQSDLPQLFDKFGQGLLPPIKDALNILLVDVGMKHSIVRRFIERGCNVKVVPYDAKIMEHLDGADGIFLSNGPGNPGTMGDTVNEVRRALEGNKPIWGICFGNQILSLAAGGQTAKMQYGNRGVNQPVRNALTGAVTITSQNHGYEVKADSLPKGWRQYLSNLNDGSCEGILCDDAPFYSVQFHPEAEAGPLDEADMFNQFIRICEAQKQHIQSSASGDPKWFSQKTKRPWTEFLSADGPLNVGIGELLARGGEGTPNTPSAMMRKKEIKTAVLPKKVLVLGSGGLQIGQAGEFDYSGSQAIKALKEEGVESILINPNIATVQTAVGLADKVYFHPVNLEFVTSIIEKERPDGLMLQFGGQTALNTGLQLDKAGILAKYNCRILGTSANSIEMTEDRALFAKAMIEIGESICESRACNTVPEVLKAAVELQYPVILRAAFSLGGLGSGFAYSPAELEDLANKAFTYADQVLIEQSVKGWKEAEYEVVRDQFDNCVTVCNMENFDPMGVHTGDSIVVAPSQTLTDFEYNMLRQASINTVRKLQIIGECNVQFGLDSKSHRYCIIECNPRLSRSSALASKATGYPLAFVAAKLALGYSMHEVTNKVTGVTPASFEPSLDYIVTKFPRWDMAKFSGVKPQLGSGMMSVGEVMSIGRSFEESFMKAIRMQTEFKKEGLVPAEFKGYAALDAALSGPTPERVYEVARAFKEGYSVSKVNALTSIDPWFLSKLERIQQVNQYLGSGVSLKDLDANVMKSIKLLGFSDKGIAQGLGGVTDMEVRSARKAMGITPVVKQIDTLAAEFPAQTNYLYVTYHGSAHDIKFGGEDQTDVIVLGGGCYKIGSSVEFDFSCVGVARTARAEGKKVALINFNPETVSTDYDESDRLYFDELSLERVLDINDIEQATAGVVVSVGGQIPQDLAVPLKREGVRVLGTCPSDIDNAEIRSKFSALCDENGIKQPEWKELVSLDQVNSFIAEVGYPVLCRPSYVLSGGGMQVIYDEAGMKKYLATDSVVSADYPVVVSKFYKGCFEADIDAIAQNGKVLCYGIADHIELAGTHSGDAHLVLPPYRVSQNAQQKILDIGGKLAKMHNISGPFNAQFIVTPEDEVLVIECNVRASRSLPFMSKTLQQDMVNIMGKVLLGTDMSHVKPVDASKLGYFGVKAPQFSWTRLKGADPRTGVEMASTGEVATFAETVEEGFLMSLSATHLKFPKKSFLFSAQDADDMEPMAKVCQDCVDMKYAVVATESLADVLKQKGIPHKRVSIEEGVDVVKRREVDYLFSIPSTLTQDNAHEQGPDGAHYSLRRNSVDYSVPCIAEFQLVKMYMQALKKTTSFNLDAYQEGITAVHHQ